MLPIQRILLAVGAAGALGAATHIADEPDIDGPAGEIYGFVQTDVIMSSTQLDPNWYDAARPTKLPSVDKEYGEDGDTSFSVRQTRFGVRSWLPTDLGQIKGLFEFDLFGVGADEGQTTIRLRHAYLEYLQFGAGQYHSPFMDIDVFPNSLDYWGPNGMAFYRNVQVRWMPLQEEQHNATIALENPGFSLDQAGLAEAVDTRTPFPDLSGEYRYSDEWGYVEGGAILRYMAWDDPTDNAIDSEGSAVGWGLSVSSNVVIPETGTIKAQLIFGQGIQNYMNDATIDAAGSRTGDGTDVEVVPMASFVLFYDHTWNDRMTSAIGISGLAMDLDDTAVAADSFESGSYALVNLLYKPAPNLMTGVELQLIGRENFDDGFDSDSVRIQFSAKYAYDYAVGK